jgi:hypothetical protein
MVWPASATAPFGELSLACRRYRPHTPLQTHRLSLASLGGLSACRAAVSVETKTTTTPLKVDVKSRVDLHRQFCTTHAHGSCSHYSCPRVSSGAGGAAAAVSHQVAFAGFENRAHQGISKVPSPGSRSGSQIVSKPSFDGSREPRIMLKCAWYPDRINRNFHVFIYRIGRIGPLRTRPIRLERLRSSTRHARGRACCLVRHHHGTRHLGGWAGGSHGCEWVHRITRGQESGRARL